MKGPTEGQVRSALGSIDLDGLVVYKPPDDARNWKPCDYMVWWWADGPDDQVKSEWVEVKQTGAAGTLSVSVIRPAQRQGILSAVRAGIPYWLLVYWTRHGDWTVSRIRSLPEKGWTRVQLASSLGTKCNTRDLAPVLRMAFLGELD